MSIILKLEYKTSNFYKKKNHVTISVITKGWNVAVKPLNSPLHILNMILSQQYPQKSKKIKLLKIPN